MLLSPEHPSLGSLSTAPLDRESLEDQLASGNHLDDIFGSSPESSPTLRPSEPESALQAQVSDIPALRRTHVTSGYRDGIAASKEQYVQEGFDEGFALGAVIGQKAGWVLGVLEGVVIALHAACQEKRPTFSSQPRSAEESVPPNGLDAHHKQETHTRFKQAVTLLRDARRELQTTSIFNRELFAEDGIWKYEVPLQPGQNAEDVTFQEVAAAHPLVKRWCDIIEDLARDWSIDLSVYD